MCKGCRQVHREWYEVSEEKAVQVLRDWASFLEIVKPYSPEGELKPRWREVVAKMTERGEAITAARLLKHFEASLVEDVTPVEKSAALGYVQSKTETKSKTGPLPSTGALPEEVSDGPKITAVKTKSEPEQTQPPTSPLQGTDCLQNNDDGLPVKATTAIDSGYHSAETEAQAQVEGQTANLGVVDNASPANDHGLESDDGAYSVVSDKESLSSRQPSKRTSIEHDAEELLTRFLANDRTLRPLIETTLKHVDTEKFVRNVRRLLKSYYLNLCRHSTSTLERRAITFMRNNYCRERVALSLARPMEQKSQDEQELDSYNRLVDLSIIENRVEAWLKTLKAGLYGGAQENDYPSQGSADCDDAEIEDNESEEAEDAEAVELPHLNVIEGLLGSEVPFKTLIIGLRVYAHQPYDDAIGLVNSTAKLLVYGGEQRVTTEQSKGVLRR